MMESEVEENHDGVLHSNYLFVIHKNSSITSEQSNFQALRNYQRYAFSFWCVKLAEIFLISYFLRGNFVYHTGF